MANDAKHPQYRQPPQILLSSSHQQTIVSTPIITQTFNMQADTKENIDLEQQSPSVRESAAATNNIERERAELLAQLPNPDAGKSDEEKQDIVRCTLSLRLCA